MFFLLNPKCTLSCFLIFFNLFLPSSPHHISPFLITSFSTTCQSFVSLQFYCFLPPLLISCLSFFIIYSSTSLNLLLSCSIPPFYPSILSPVLPVNFHFSVTFPSFILITSHNLPPTIHPLTLFLPLLLLLQVRLLYCSLEEAELVFRAAWASGQAGPSHMWFAVGPALSGLGLEGLPKALFAIRPQGWRDEPRRYEHFFCMQSSCLKGLTTCKTCDTLCP